MIDLSFVKNHNGTSASCQGPASTLMAFKYFFPDQTLTYKELYDALGYVKGSFFFEVYIVEFFNKRGVPAKYVSENMLLQSDSPILRAQLGITDTTDDLNPKRYDASVQYVQQKDLFSQQVINKELIKRFLDKGKVCIATVNSKVLTKKEGYKAHFIVIKGYTSEGLICNDAEVGENLLLKYTSLKEAFTNQGLRQAELVVLG